MIVCWTSAPLQAAEISCHVFYAGVNKQGISDRGGIDKDGALKSWPSGRTPTPSVTCLRGFLSGEIFKGDYDKVVAFLKAHHPFLDSFILNSPGGDADEGIRIGRLFRKYLIDTTAYVEVEDGENQFRCASACALIWFGGVNRNWSVGVHRPRISDPMFRGLSPADASTAYRQVLGRIAAYLEEMEVPKSIIELMIGTGSNDIRRVNDYDDGVDPPPSIAEWEDASCGPGSNIQTGAKILAKKGINSLAFQKHDQQMLCVTRLLNNHRDRLARP